MKWAKNVHFIELFVYKQVQLLPFHPLLFHFFHFSRHAFTPTDFQYITVNLPVFSFHTPFTLEIEHYPLTISQNLKKQKPITTVDSRNHGVVSRIISVVW